MVETKEGLLPGVIENSIFWGMFDLNTEASVRNCNIRDGYDGAGNVTKNPEFVNDRINLFADAVNYQVKKYYTRVFCSDIILVPNQLIGRVVRTGDKWGVVRSNDAHNLDIWGNLSGEVELTILPSYKFK
jgi:hypothetical protein